jgi:hypothetical protein
VQTRLVATAEDAALVLLASPTLNPTCEGDYEGWIDNVAVRKAGWDVLRGALLRGLYTPQRGEEPSAAQLRGEGRRAA